MSQTDSVPPQAKKLIFSIVLAEDSRTQFINHAYFLFFFYIQLPAVHVFCQNVLNAFYITVLLNSQNSSNSWQ